MKTILCIDDEPMILKALKRDLASFARVLTAESAAEGLRIANEEDVSVVISDFRMPVMSGLELMQILRTSHPDVVRVLLTGQADVAMLASAINEGHVYRFLMKPWTREEMHVMIRRSLDLAGRLEDARKAASASTERRLSALDGLEHAFPGISAAPRSNSGVIEIDAQSLETDDLYKELAALAQ